MTGISEILILILLIALVFIIPRMMAPAPKREARMSPKKISVKLRAGIVASILVPVVAALMLKPWENNLIAFIAIGILPVALLWALAWIMAGNRSQGRRN